MFFSVITISYNQAAFLRKCLDSVASQTSVGYEHLVVDPGSSDGSRDIILKHGSSAITPIFEEDSCPAEGLNNGLKRASGEYVLFINSDDYFLDGAFHLIYRELEKSGFPDIIFFGGYIENVVTRQRTRTYPGSPNGKFHALGLSQIFQQGAVIRTALVKKAGGFNTANSTCWDGELFLQLLANPKVHALRRSDPVAVFLIHSGSITGSSRLQSQYRRDSALIAKTYYGDVIYRLRTLILLMPRVFRIALKYILDPKLAFWRIASIPPLR
jgi:glycosyltransferase involved in cell wall biosynthesis